MQASGMCSKEEANLLLFGRASQGKPSLARLTETKAKADRQVSRVQRL